MSTAKKKSTTAAKKTSAKKASAKKTSPKKKSAKKVIPKPVTSAAPKSTGCKCKQKKPNGKFFCFRMVQGRWVQSSLIPFATKEACEEAMC